MTIFVHHIFVLGQDNCSGQTVAAWHVNVRQGNAQQTESDAPQRSACFSI